MKSEEIESDKKPVIDALTKNGQLYIPRSALTSSDRTVTTYYPGGIQQLRQEVHTLLAQFPTSLIKLIEQNREFKIEIVPFSDIQDKTGSVLIRETKIGKYDGIVKTASVNIRAIKNSKGVFEEEITHLLDNLLGDDPPSNKRFSEGYARSEKLIDIARQLNMLYNKSDLPYIEEHINDSRDYLAQGGVRRYLKDPDYLKEKDPALHEFIRDIFLNEKLWEDNL